MTRQFWKRQQVKSRPKAQPPTSIRFTAARRKFLEMTAAAQGHYTISEVINRLIDRELKHEH